MLRAQRVKTFTEQSPGSVKYAWQAREQFSDSFIGGTAGQETMVSRSLEKMMLIAVGLTTAVMVGVPVLLYAIDTVNAASEFELARTFAQEVQNATGRVDLGIVANVTSNVYVPNGVTVTAAGNTLTVSYQKGTQQPIVWTSSYAHSIVIVLAPISADTCNMEVRMASGTIEIIFVPHP